MRRIRPSRHAGAQIASRACSSDGPSRSIANQKGLSAPTDPTSVVANASRAPTGVTEERLGVGQGEHDRERSTNRRCERDAQKEDRCPVRTGVVGAAARRAHVTNALDGVNTSEVGDLG